MKSDDKTAFAPITYSDKDKNEIVGFFSEVFKNNIESIDLLKKLRENVAPPQFVSAEV